MCGVYGMVWKNPARPADVEALDRMGAALVHRGPDAAGQRVDGPLGIGMRRLSIIDLGGGDQPIANEDGSLWVVLNGEIYNYRELRVELEAAGHRFRTASDTEVLVHLYEEHGARSVERVRGMFAFAIWIPRRGELFLARDRLGIKPLYWAETRDAFVFASELRALLRSGVIEPELAPTSVGAYLRLGYVPDPDSVVRGVSKLAPAHTMHVRDGHALGAVRYWDHRPFFEQPIRMAEDEAREALWDALRDAVRSHLVSDVPVGAFLSGGVDSTTVLTLMASASSRRIETFSLGFGEPGYDEQPYARRVAEWLGTDHHELTVGPEEALDRLDDVLGAFDEPFADASAIPTFLVSELARRRVKVVLSGDGGDELFAGYDRYRREDGRRHLAFIGEAGLGAPLRVVSDALPEGTRGKRYLHALSLARIDRYVEELSLFPRHALADLVEPELLGGVTFEDRVAAGRGLDPLSRLQDLDLRTYLPGDILTKVDRATMANSVEARVPLLDHPLVELACRVPAGWRLSRGRTKYLLRRTVRGRIPDEVLDRPKLGFGVPIERWFTTWQPRFFRDRLGDGERLADAGLRAHAVRRLLDLHERTRRREHSERLWGLLVLDRTLETLGRVPA